jgi:UDP-N-acetylglucosamine enolpyruvyl transferase
LKVLAAGLHEMGAECEMAAADLSSVAPPPVAASSWQGTAAVVNMASAGSRKDVAALAAQIGAFGANLHDAGDSYTTIDGDAAARLARTCG